MQLAHIKTVTKDSQPITIRLGDVFILKPPFYPTKQGFDISSFVVLGLLTTALVKGQMSSDCIYFTMVGMDRLKYSVSKTTEHGLVILDHGKEIELEKDYIIRAISRLSGNRVTKVDGIQLYTRTLWTSADDIKKMDMYRLDIRMRDMSKWPKQALRTWAIRHLDLPSMQIPPSEMIGDKAHMVNATIKLAAIAHHKVIQTESTDNNLATYHGLVRHNRCNRIDGIQRINLSPNEVTPSINYGAIIRPHKDLPRECLIPYSIVYVGNQPRWIVLNNELGQTTLSWRFYNGKEALTPVYNFNAETERWLLDIVPREPKHRGIHAGGYIKYNPDGVISGRIVDHMNNTIEVEGNNQWVRQHLYGSFENLEKLEIDIGEAENNSEPEER